MRALALLLAGWLAAGCIDDGALDDRAAPDTELTAAPAPLSNLASEVLRFEASEPATFTCSLDGAAATPCESPYVVELADGAHGFEVTAIDAAGNPDPSPATSAWTTDTLAPSTTFVVAPPAIDSSTTVRFEFRSDDADATFECAFDSTIYAACVSPTILSTISDGSHSFRVRATDPAGNVDATPALRNWSLGPTVAITGGPAEGSTTGPHAEFVLSSSPGAMLTCHIDDDEAVPCGGRATFQLPAGDHSFTLTGSDGTHGSSVTRSWTVACGAPTARADSRGVLHFDEPAGTQAVDNAVAGQPAGFLGTSAAAEARDPARIVAGRFGAGLSFASGAQQVVTWPAAIAPRVEHTIELWVRPAAVTADDEVLLTSADGHLVIALDVDENGVRIEYRLVDGDGIEVSDYSLPVTTGVWHHVVVSYGPVQDQMLVLVDGLDDHSGRSPNAVLPIDLSTVLLGAPTAAGWGVATHADLDEVHLRADPITLSVEALDTYCPLPRGLP